MLAHRDVPKSVQNYCKYAPQKMSQTRKQIYYTLLTATPLTAWLLFTTFLVFILASLLLPEYSSTRSSLKVFSKAFLFSLKAAVIKPDSGVQGSATKKMLSGISNLCNF